MLIVRFKETFRQRVMEWVLSCILTVWGATLINNPEAFQRPFFAALDAIAGPKVWGWCSLSIGVMRLMFLFINGAWRRSPVLRQIGCLFGMMVWSGLLFGSLSANAPTAVSYMLGILIMETLSLSFAASDGARYRNPKAVAANGG